MFPSFFWLQNNQATVLSTFFADVFIIIVAFSAALQKPLEERLELILIHV